MKHLTVRAWDTVRKKWIQDYFISPDGDVMAFSSNMYYNGLHETIIELTEYIGLKDKEGTKIYENDILSHYGDMWQVIYYNKAACFMANGLSKRGNGITGETKTIGDTLVSNVNEVSYIMGNIYENPELIK